MKIKSLSIYPIKSIAGIHLSSIFLNDRGPDFDRRFMLVTSDGKMVTARKYPQMVLIKASLMFDGLYLQYKNNSSLHVHYDDFDENIKHTEIWGDAAYGNVANERINKWFSDILDVDVSLIYQHDNQGRFANKASRYTSYADGYPLLILSTASIDELNKRSPIKHNAAQFRANILIQSDTPFIEDTWSKIRIGDSLIELVEPCPRCVLTTINTETAEKNDNAEPIKTLSSFRKSANNAIHFAMNANVLEKGMISVDDDIEILETRQPEIY